jgi:hypothetical protein
MLRELVLAGEKARGLLLCLNVAQGAYCGALGFCGCFSLFFFVLFLAFIKVGMLESGVSLYKL